MRETDRVKEYKSYILQRHPTTREWYVKQSHWVPGYSAAHKATPEAAIQYRMDILHEEIKAANSLLSTLHKLKNDTKEKN